MAHREQEQEQEQEEEYDTTDQREAVEATAETGMNPAVIAAAATVLLSWHQFFLKGNRDMGLFVATWPPTILAFASFFNQTEMSDRLKETV